MAMFKGILFDNDGTLVDTHDLILSSMRHCTRTVLGVELPEEVLLHKVGQPLAVQMCDFTDDEELQVELLRVYREHNHSIHDDVVAAFPGAKEALARLSGAGVRMGVVTSKVHALAWRGLEITGLAPYLDCCIGADDCVHYKPEPEPVVRGCEAIGLEPAECLYVGDSPYDIHAGNAAGCKTAAVSWGVFSLDEMRAENPTYEFNSFEQFADAFSR